MLRLSGPSAQWVVVVLLAACGGVPPEPHQAARLAGTYAPADAGAYAQGPGESQRVLAEGESQPTAIAVDERYVYWAVSDGVRRAPREGGEVVSLVQGAQPSQLVVAVGSLFFSDARAGTVTRVDRERGSTQIVGRGVSPSGLAVRDGRIYWANGGMTVGQTPDGSLASAALDGSDARVIFEGASQPAAIAVDAEHLYFTSTSGFCWGSTPGGSGSSGCVGGGVSRLPRDGGTPVLLGARDTASGVALGARGAYWVVGSPMRVMFSAFGSDGAEPLAQRLDLTPGPFQLHEGALYMASSERGRVVEIALDGGAVTPLAVDLGSVGGVAVDRDSVYLTQPAQGRVVRVAKDGSAAKPAAPVTGPCPMPLGAADEIAATPRADQPLEQLALRLDDERVVASQETYERVLADVKAIRSLAPALAEITHAPRDDGRALLLATTDMALQSMQANAYSAWDCLNTHYGLEERELMSLGGRGYVMLRLKGLYNLRLLSQLYRMLPGIVSADPNSSGGGGPTICARRSPDGIEYVVDRASGDCLGGCTEHDARRFVSRAAGVVEAAEAWSSMSGAPRPDWFERTCAR